MHRRLIPGFFAVLIPFVVPPPARAQDAGFVPLFNGRDLSGWVNVNGSPETWSVREGMIHCDGTPVCALRTERPYENFVFEAEWRHLKSGGNAGIFIWADPLPAPGQPFLRSIEVQVLDHGYGTSDWFTTHGDVFAIHGSTMKPFPPAKGMRSFPTENRSKGSPEWNHYRVTCEDGTIRLAVNGKDVSGGSDCVWRKGYIGLESEGAPVDWRNIRIRELPGGKATPEQTAPLAAAAVTLYDGRSLRGWIEEEAARKNWKPSDSQLQCLGTGGALRRNEPIGQGTLQLDVRATTERESAPLTVKIGKATLSAELPAGWTRVTVRRAGGEAILMAGGRELARASVGEGPAPLSIETTRPSNLTNIYWTAEPPA